VVEGLWTNSLTGVLVPAYHINLAIDSLEKPEARAKTRLVMHDSVDCVLTRPTVDTILYVRQADEVINPLLGRRTVNQHVDIYDFQSGRLDYYHHNHATDLIKTNMSGREDFDRQGREIAFLMQTMGRVYRGDTPHLNRKNSPTIYVDSYGKATQFFLQTSMERRSAELVRSKVPAIRADLLQTEGESAFLSMWATSFDEMARGMKDDLLIQRAKESPDWSMVPLMADYDLVLGCIRSTLTGMLLEKDAPAAAQDK